MSGLRESAVSLLERANRSLRPTEMKLLLALVILSADEPTEPVKFGWLQFRRAGGVSELAVGKALKGLLDRGVVRLEQPRRGVTPAAYSINWHWQPEQPQQELEAA